MTIRFHPPEDLEGYGQQVLALLVQAALPGVRARLKELLREEAGAQAADGPARR